IAVYEPRAKPDALARDRRRDVGHLQRRDADAALPDAGGPGGEIPPRALVFIGQSPAGFGDADSRRPSQSESLHPEAQALDLKFVGGRFEKHIARSFQRVRKRERSIGVAIMTMMR